VAEDPERVVVSAVAGRQDLDALAVGKRKTEILNAAVEPDEHGIARELRPDRACGVEPGRPVGKFELGGVREDDLHGARG